MIALLLFAATASAQTPLPHGYVFHERAGNVMDVVGVACAGSHAFMRSWSGRTAHWDGSGWTNIGEPSGQAYGRSIAARSDGHAFIAASGRVAEWNGSSWIDHALEPAEGEIGGLWSTGGSVFLAGRGRIAMLGTGGFRNFDPGTWRDLVDVWGTSPSDLWIAGQGGTVMRRRAGRFARERTNSDAWLQGIFGTGPNDVWVWAHDHQRGATILRFDGSAWNAIDATNLTGQLHAVGGAPSLVYAVGDFGVARFDGRSRFVVDLAPAEIGTGYHVPRDVCATDRHLVIGDSSGGAIMKAL